ncbi:MAG TPA: 50S ribosomal protein L3 N(5)-glutamine methyltransferase, partial [Wenzhouxiangella sp.]
AERNIHRLRLGSRVRLHLSDVYEALSQMRFDVILANPPYVPESSMQTLPEEYQHEPSLGLVAGQTGLDVVIRLLQEAPAHLEPGGVLICEVGEAAEAFDLWALAQRLEIVWLEFEHGGDGVFLVTEPVLAARFPTPK